MMYDTIAEGIRATIEDAKAEGWAKGWAEGRTESEAELLAKVAAHMFPEHVDAFRCFLTSRSRDAWPDVSDLLSWTGTGTEFMAWLENNRGDSADGQPRRLLQPNSSRNAPADSRNPSANVPPGGR